MTPTTIICPQCGATLRIHPPPPGVPVIQVVTTLRCPICGTDVMTVPTGGYRVEGVSPGGGTSMGGITGIQAVQCPNCGHWYTVVRGSATTTVTFQCKYCGTSLGSYPSGSRLIDLYLQTTPPNQQTQPSFWEKYKWYIIGGGIGLLVLLAIFRRR